MSDHSTTDTGCGCGTCSCSSTAPRTESHVRTFVDELLEQESLLHTPVARFASAHASGSQARLATERAQLLPLSAPAPDEQYAFEVDLDACSGCKACVAACHSLNGLDEGESWRDVGLIQGGTAFVPYQQTITSACHHCAEPGCLEGCPVLAYEKDPVTGIVRHLDDQCIGCQYCILKCPYDVPKYNPRLGIVRKCDMCHQRLAEGEAPACVQACPTHAIRIVKVLAGPKVDTSRFLPVAPDPSYTRPTTRYVGRMPIPENATASDAFVPYPQPVHLSLVFMLTLTQLGYGLLLPGALDAPERNAASLLGVGLIAAGLAASVTHLGRPLRAWRIFLGLRRSWLSREAVLLGASFALLGAALLGDLVPLPLVSAIRTPLWQAALLTGLVGIFCSAMIYIDTRRHFWAWPRTMTRMGGTVLVAALALPSPSAAGLALLAKLCAEAWGVLGTERPASEKGRSARLLLGILRPWLLLRIASGLLAAGLFLAGQPLPALPFLLLGELLERSLYFRAVDVSKMPGNPAP